MDSWPNNVRAVAILIIFMITFVFGFLLFVGLGVPLALIFAVLFVSFGRQAPAVSQRPTEVQTDRESKENANGSEQPAALTSACARNP